MLASDHVQSDVFRLFRRVVYLLELDKQVSYKIPRIWFFSTMNSDHRCKLQRALIGGEQKLTLAIVCSALRKKKFGKFTHVHVPDLYYVIVISVLLKQLTLRFQYVCKQLFGPSFRKNLIGFTSNALLFVKQSGSASSSAGPVQPVAIMSYTIRKPGSRRWWWPTYS